METRLLPANSALSDAAGLLQAGEVVAFPTETVYGLGGDARSAAAVQKIYEAKGRPPGNPLIVHVHSVEAARVAAASWPAIAGVLADKFWPGPLTLILPRGPGISPLVSAGRSTVALRCPDHPVALTLLRQFNGPVAAPSANRSGFTSPTTAQHVLAELAGRIPLILDGGPSGIGLESTVLDLSLAVPAVLRPGAITLDMLRPFIPGVEQCCAVVSTEDSAASPGQHFRHYAPRAPAYRFSKMQWPIVKQRANRAAPVALLSHDASITFLAPHETTRMPAAESDYARILYAALRAADDQNPAAIFILLPDTKAGLWSAIHDRLERATQILPPDAELAH